MGNPIGWLKSGFKAVTGAPDFAKELLQDVKDASDALHHSGEEKAQEAFDLQKMILDKKMKWLDVTMSQNPTRKILALRITTYWLSVLTLWAIFAIVHAFVGGENWKDASDIIQTIVNMITSPVTTIIMFYFAIGGTANGIKGIIHATKSK